VEQNASFTSRAGETDETTKKSIFHGLYKLSKKMPTPARSECKLLLGHPSFTFELKTRKKTLIAQLSLFFFIKTPQSFDSVRRSYSPFMRCYRPESVGTMINAQGKRTIANDT
jgi:hypothetical protein